jgi:hypothetical protein
MSHLDGKDNGKNNLKINDSLNLPTHWTNDNADETIYLFTKDNIEDNRDFGTRLRINLTYF